MWWPISEYKGSYCGSSMNKKGGMNQIMEGKCGGSLENNKGS
jgi:hypothetical protein